MTSYIEHIFMYLFSIQRSSFVKSFGHVLLLFLNEWHLRLQKTVDITLLNNIYFANIFSLSVIYLHSLTSVLHRGQVFNFDKVQFMIFLNWIAHAFGIVRNLAQPTNTFLLFSHGSIIILSFMFVFVHFELIFYIIQSFC